MPSPSAVPRPSGRRPAPLLLAVALLASALSPRRAAAEWRMGVEAVTDFPMHLGGKIWAEFPGRVRLATSLGYVPGGYLDVINGAATGVGSYSNPTADLLATGLADAFSFRLHVGFRIFRGLYVEAAYGLLTEGGGTLSARRIGLASGAALPSEDVSRGYRIEATVHQIHGEIGWQWVFVRFLTLRAGLGFSAAVDASSTVRPNFAPQVPAEQAAFTRAAARHLDGTFTSHLFVPTLAVAIGFRFF